MATVMFKTNRVSVATTGTEEPLIRFSIIERLSDTIVFNVEEVRNLAHALLQIIGDEDDEESDEGSTPDNPSTDPNDNDDDESEEDIA